MEEIDFIKKRKEKFDKFLGAVIEKFIQIYGEEYRELIKDRIANTYIELKSDPIEEYKYVNGEISEEKLSKQAKEYNEILEEIKKYFLETRKIYINEIINILKSLNINLETTELQSKYIFNLDMNVKELRQIFINLLPKEQRKPETETIINAIISQIEALNINYKTLILKNTNFGKEIHDKIQSKFNLNIDFSILSSIIFKIIPTATLINGQRFLICPLAKFINSGFKGIDLMLIHELIHIIEFSKNNLVGIANGDTKENMIANEIRTQNLAIRVAKELQQEGIYFIDDPSKTIENYGNGSSYECLFPISFDFFEKYQSFFNECSINNDYQSLVDFFGKEWIEYSKYLQIQFNLIANLNKKLNIEEVKKLIDDMESSYNKMIQSQSNQKSNR